MFSQSRASLLTALFFLFSLSTAGQISPADVPDITGLKPYETYAGTGENINLGTGNLNITVPLLKIPGRAGHDFDLQTSYDSKNWALRKQFDISGDLIYNWDLEHRNQSEGFGWTVITAPYLTYTGNVHNNALAATCISKFVLLMPSGKKYNFIDAYSYCHSDSNAGVIVPGHPTSYSGDLDLAYFDATLGDTSLNKTDGLTVTLRNSTRMFFDKVNGAYRINRVQDRNGNLIRYRYNSSGTLLGWTDSTGRTALNVTSTASSTQVTYKDSNGVTSTITLNLASQTLSPSFAQPVVSSPDQVIGWGPASRVMLSSIQLPNGRSYAFTYNNFGELTKVTYPTGGYTRYAYSAFPHKDVVVALTADYREVTDKYECRNASGTCATEDHTSYTPTTNSANQFNLTNTVIDAAGNKTISDFGLATYSSTYETRRRVYNGTATLLRTINTTYSTVCYPRGTLAPEDKNFAITFPTSVQTTLEDGQVSLQQTDYDSVLYPVMKPLQTRVTCLVDHPTQKREYAFGAAGSPVRKTLITWLQTNPVNAQDYTSLSIYNLDLKASESVWDGPTNTQFSSTTYEYDNYAYGTPNIAASGAVQHNSGFGTSFKTRGNLTAVKRWRDTDNVWLATKYTYDDAGNILSSIDPANHTTKFSYADAWANIACLPSGGNAAAYVGMVTNANNQTFNYTFNSCAGTMASRKDENGQVTSLSYDGMSRLVRVDFPDQGQISRTFNEASLPLTVDTTTKITASLSRVTNLEVDGLGRARKTRLTSDPEGAVYTRIEYDAVGRKYQEWNPTRCDPDTTSTCSGETTFGITTYSYDGLGRLTKVIPPDGTPTTNNVVHSYAGNCTTVSDQAQKSRKTCTDALGRTVQLFEDPAGVNYETDYQYNVANDLRQVDQKGTSPTNSANWRTRTFLYSSLSQLKSSTNPESGTIAYTYDNAGNVQTKQAPLPNQTGTATITTNYTYDSLDRLTGKTYTDSTPPVKYGYDGVALAGCTTAPPTLVDSFPTGRRTAMCDGSGATSWSHDQMGRMLGETRTILGTSAVTKSLGYQYNFDGSLAALTYPSGNVLTYTPNGAGRPISVIDVPHNIQYVTAATYSPHGELSRFTMGASSTFAGITENDSYNNRLQHAVISASTPTQTVFSASYGYLDSGQNNGNVISINNNLDPTRNQTYTYDSLNRVLTGQSAATSGTACWGQQFGYDAWANLQSISGIKTLCSSPQFSTSADAQNRLIGFGYDAAGNLTQEGSGPPSWSYAWDAEGRLTGISGSASASFGYDGDNQRTKFTGKGLFWRQLNGPFLSKTGMTGSVIVERIYFGGRHIAGWHPGGSVSYYVQDALGGEHLSTDAAGNVCEDLDTLPFGSLIKYLNNCDNSYQFAGMERDDQTSANLDYAIARYYNNRMGRFLSSDSVLITPERFYDPQQLNSYAYVRNNPVRLVDSTGMTLIVSGNLEADKSELCRIAGDACDRLSIDPKTGTVSFNAAGLDLTKNEGASLINDLVQSKNNYGFTEGGTVETAGGTVKVDYILNLPPTTDQLRFRKSGTALATELPKRGIADQVAFNPNDRGEHRSLTNLGLAQPWTVVFHELAEAYAKIDGSKSNSYSQSHGDAIGRENVLRDQRPYLKDYNPGSGGPSGKPDNTVIIKR